MRRKKSVSSIAFGAALVAVLGSGLLALSSDSVTSQGNNVQSGTFTPPVSDRHDLKAAKIPAGGNCATATYTDGPFTAAISSGGTPNINLQNGTGATQVDNFCLKNAGSQTGKLVVSFASAADTEVGVCETSEQGAGDATCADGAAGELKPILQAFWTEDNGSTSASCSGISQLPFSTFETTPQVLDTDIAAGESCVVFLGGVGLGTATDNQKLQAQTDKVQWDIVFTLQDV